MKQKLLITVAICTYNRAHYLEDTLRDLAAQTEEPSQFEILVINNNSQDETSGVCSRFSETHRDIRFRWVNEEKQGLSHARNRAVNEAAGSYLLYIDDDVHLEKDFLEQAIRCVDLVSGLTCVGGRIFVTFDDTEPDWIPDELMPMFGLHDLGDEMKKYPSGNFPRGGNMLIHKNLFRRIGLFDTNLGRTGPVLSGSEEKDFFDKVRKSGVEPWYVPRLVLWHRIGKRRLDRDYLKKQSAGIGRSERVRLSGSPTGLGRKFFSEIVKLAGSLLLAVGYIVKGKAGAARFLILFRFWVLQGFFGKNFDHNNY